MNIAAARRVLVSVAVESAVRLADGREVELRPLQPAERDQLVRLFYRLSPESVYHRFMSPLREPSQLGLDRLLNVDHQAREAVAAVAGGEVVGVARYFREGESGAADMAVVVEDAWQRNGLSLALIGRLVELARSHGIESFTATMLSENRAAIGMVRRAFPRAVFRLDGPELRATMPFEPPLT